MKSYTDLQQSKKLAEILPGDSADMCWGICNETLKWKTIPYLLPWRDYTAKEYYLPCWSLAALLEVIGVECRMEKTPLDQSGEFTYSMVDDYNNRTFECGNPVDACVEMILKLKEKDLIKTT